MKKLFESWKAQVKDEAPQKNETYLSWYLRTQVAKLEQDVERMKECTKI